jgi:hypothetical protein
VRPCAFELVTYIDDRRLRRVCVEGGEGRETVHSVEVRVVWVDVVPETSFCVFGLQINRFH